MSQIPIPQHWQNPKYQLGQLVEQGRIIGIEYHPQGTARAYELGSGWFYTVLKDELETEVDIYRENRIEPASYEQIETQINTYKNSIAGYQDKIAFLTKQLNNLHQ